MTRLIWRSDNNVDSISARKLTDGEGEWAASGTGGLGVNRYGVSASNLGTGRVFENESAITIKSEVLVNASDNGKLAARDIVAGDRTSEFFEIVGVFPFVLDGFVGGVLGVSGVVEINWGLGRNRGGVGGLVGRGRTKEEKDGDSNDNYQ